jgi:hypothetical protein
MLRHRRNDPLSASSLAKLWGFNLLLAFMVLSTYVGVPFFKSSVLEYQNIQSEPFDGTVMPISYVPNWLDAKNWNKSLRFEDIPTDSYVEIPRYDADLLKIDDPKNRMAVLERGTYITPYMGSYRMNFEEYDGSHLAVDIRAPLGTPVLAAANGVVVKTNDQDSGDGKYVLIRHDNVPTASGTVTLYSIYLHLESVSVDPGTKIRKGQPIGKVGMTGITTTPHLHFQIDRDTAPFHPYWPYTFQDARDIGIGFFDAVNVGLGKENALKYTIHPMEFVQANLDGAPAATVSSAKSVAVAATNVSSVTTGTTLNAAPPESATSTVPASTPAASVPPVSPDILPSAQIQTVTPVVTATISSVIAGTARVTRAQAVVDLGTRLGLSPADPSNLPFSDVLPSDPEAGMLATFVRAGYVGSVNAFRPNDAITRAEIAIILVRISAVKQVTSKVSMFRDVKATDSRAPYLNAFAKTVRLKSGSKLAPETPVTGSDFVNTVAVWKMRTGRP